MHDSLSPFTIMSRTGAFNIVTTIAFHILLAIAASIQLVRLTIAFKIGLAIVDLRELGEDKTLYTFCLT